MFSAQIIGLEQINRLLKASNSMEPVLRKYAEYRRRAFKEQIDRGVDPYGEPYAPLTQNYLLQKRRESSGSILERSGDMLRSHQVTVSANGIEESVNNTGNFHQSGTSRMSRRMLFPDPAMGLPEKEESVFVRLMKEHYGAD